MHNEKNQDASQSSILVLTAMEEDYLRKEYQNTFEDYLELLLQWAHIMLFASVFPLGGFLALLNNLYETKGDQNFHKNLKVKKCYTLTRLIVVLFSHCDRHIL